jgi:hypothetical protein
MPNSYVGQQQYRPQGRHADSLDTASDLTGISRDVLSSPTHNSSNFKAQMLISSRSQSFGKI